MSHASELAKANIDDAIEDFRQRSQDLVEKGISVNEFWSLGAYRIQRLLKDHQAPQIIVYLLRSVTWH